MNDKKTAKPVSAITADDLPAINAIIAKGDRAEVGPPGRKREGERL